MKFLILVFSVLAVSSAISAPSCYERASVAESAMIARQTGFSFHDTINRLYFTSGGNDYVKEVSEAWLDDRHATHKERLSAITLYKRKVFEDCRIEEKKLAMK